MTLLHCLCCRGQYVGEVRGTGTPSSLGASMLYDCPGVTCPTCASTEAVVEVARKAKIFLKNLSFRTGVDVRAGKEGYALYESLRDALAALEAKP